MKEAQGQPHTEDKASLTSFVQIESAKMRNTLKTLRDRKKKHTGFDSSDSSISQPSDSEVSEVSSRGRRLYKCGCLSSHCQHGRYQNYLNEFRKERAHKIANQGKVCRTESDETQIRLGKEQVERVIEFQLTSND